MNEFEKSVKVLKIKGDVSKATVKKAYRELIKVHHPDKYTNPVNKEKATENFKKIQKAYEYLSEYLQDTTSSSTSSTTNKSSGLYEKPKMHKSGEPIEEQYAETVKNYKKRAKKFQQEYYTCNGKRTTKTDNKHDFYKEEKPKTTYTRTIRKPKRKSSSTTTPSIEAYDDMSLGEAFGMLIVGTLICVAPFIVFFAVLFALINS